MLHRFSRPLAGLAFLVTMAALAGFASRAPGVIQAQRVELIDSKGEIQAALAADTTGVLLTLFDRSGRVVASLWLNGEPHLTVLDGAGREVAGLRAPRVLHLLE